MAAYKQRAAWKWRAQICIIAIFSLMILLLAGCTLAGSQAATNPAVNLSLSPTSASVPAGRTQQFTAAVTGSSNTAVTWSATGGSISASGMYTAPTSTGSYKVTATSMADNTVSASAAVTVTAGVSISISPISASMLTNATQQFTASITGSSNTAVTWSATGGSVSSSGLYTAPSAAGTFTVKATSVADNTKSASATVTVSVPVVAVSISPTSASIQVNGTQQFTATVTGSSNTAVTWSANGGSVSSGGLYTAPSAAGTFTVTATSAADNTKSASATVTVSTAPVVSVTISPTSASVLTNATRQFTASVSGSSNTSVTWSATGGSVFSGGLYTAPNTAGTFTVKATSVADNTKSASATVSAPQQHTVTLSWTASTSTVSGYNVYRSTVSGGPYTQTNTALNASTNYVDNSVQSGTTYFYVVTAVDADAVESAFSNQVSVVVPTP
jgi:fibronectin type 3 domain-containing protein